MLAVLGEWRQEFSQSIKSPDTEEKLDLYFYRPIGFLIAKLAFLIRLSPTHLSLLGATAGIVSGVLYFYNSSDSNLILGSALFILSGLFDSSDGQLARMTGESTEIGLVLDGICDNIVFASVYLGSAFAAVPEFGWGVIPLAFFGGFWHSLQSSNLDFLNREYLYYGYGKLNYRNLTVEEAQAKIDSETGAKRLFSKLHFSWIWQQNRCRNRYRKEFSSFDFDPQLQSLYRDHNRTLIRFWRLMGPNFHTIMIIFFVFLRRFDLYLIWVDCILLNAALLVLWLVQRNVDKNLLSQLKSHAN